MYISEQVQKLIKRYKTTSPYAICELKNIAIFYDELEPDVRGFYQYYKRKSMIHLNANIDVNLQRVVLAHELGHAVLHKDYNCVFLSRHTYMAKNIYEYQANLFSAELLLPQRVPEQYVDMSYQNLAAIYRVPIELVMMKWGK